MTDYSKKAIITRVGALETKVDSAASAVDLTDRVTALETTVDTTSTGLADRVDALETTVDTATTGLTDRVDALETTVDTATTGLTDRVDALEAFGNVVAVSGSDTMDREQNVAGLSSAITLANEVRTDMISHFANATRHVTGQQSTATLPVAATDLESLIALVTEETELYVAHNTDAVLGAAWEYHSAQTAAKALASEVVPTNLQDCVQRLNDIKAKYNGHEAENVGHDGQASVVADQVAAADAAYGAVNNVPITGIEVGDVVFWSILDNGTGNVTGVSAVAAAGYVVFTFSADPQNDCIISYIAARPAA
jgi:hypothetical protein